MSVQIAHLVADNGVRPRWLVCVRYRAIKVLERAIRERSQLTFSARRDETNVAFPKTEINSQSIKGCFDGGRGRRDVIVVPPGERKRLVDNRSRGTRTTKSAWRSAI